MYAPWVAPFLTMLAKTGNVSASATVAGVTSTAAYALRRKDADFAGAWDIAKLDHGEVCEAELTRRAFGVEEPVVYQGQLTPVYERDEHGQVRTAVVGQDRKGKEIIGPVQARNEDGSLKWLTVTKYSDPLLLAKVKAHNPAYRVERTEVTGADGAPVQMADATVRRARIASIVAAAANRVGLA